MNKGRRRMRGERRRGIGEKCRRKEGGNGGSGERTE